MRRGIAQASAGAAALLGAVTLAQYIGGWNFGIDELLFRDTRSPDTTQPGRMPIGTALAFVLLGLALARLDSRWAELLTGAALVLPAVALDGLAYDSDAVTMPFKSNAMSLPTALAFIALAASVFCARPRRGAMRLVTSAGPEGVMMRRTLLRAVALIVSIGLLAQIGYLAGLRDAQTPRLTASIGLVSAALGAATLEALVAQAGVALRSARQAGGGTVRRYDQLLGAAAPG